MGAASSAQTRPTYRQDWRTKRAMARIPSTMSDRALFTCASRRPRARERRSETSWILLHVRVPLPRDMSRALVESVGGFSTVRKNKRKYQK
ncbi:hypothetical protein WOLCODRAFT_138347 [Wolfiporia cocos MD-104 SS10]|uniref:Uncharacterized protein n=1 Tax=Wolfiporia cocos (strain MD-104) TaxID=742152 RepID=A0A2H3JU07_WOLCO|nr:hypothetical protein WOLCODRAFT_138347 [Wolfiporia cocos MD-104 SS10]